MRRFQLHREGDPTGAGVVAEGVRFRDGHVVLTCLTGTGASWAIYRSIRDVEAIHGHGGGTRIVWIDPPSPGPVAGRRSI